MSVSQWQKFHTDDVKWQTKDIRPQWSNVNTMNLWQNSQYLWNIFFSRRSIWVLLELVRRWTQNCTKIDQKKCKIEQTCIRNLRPTWFIMLTLIYVISMEFCRWVADVPPCETSPALKSEEKQLFSQARPHLHMKTDIAKTNITNNRPNMNEINITVTVKKATWVSSTAIQFLQVKK